MAGECRWRASSNTSGRNNGQQNSDVPVPLTLGGPADSILPAPGGRALLYARSVLYSDIRWLDLETGRSWPLLRALYRPFLLRVLADRFEFTEVACMPPLYSCRFGEDEPTPVGMHNFFAHRSPPERTLHVDPSRTLFWTEGDRTIEVPLSFPALGAVYEPGWPAPLAWDPSGVLWWVDLASGAGVPALPFRPLQRTP